MMSEPMVTSPPSAVAAITAMTSMFVREMVTRGRIAALGALAGLLVLLGFAVRFSDDRLQSGGDVLAGLGLGVVAPITALVLASATLGRLRSDKTLVYLWLRPVPRYTLALAATAATLVVALPLCVGSMLVAAVLTGESALAGASVLAALVTVVGYTGVFVPLGAALKRSFIVGLVYVLVWGGLLAKLGTGFASLSVESFGVSVIEKVADVELSGGNLGLTASVVSASAFLVAGVAVATWQLRRREVD